MFIHRLRNKWSSVLSDRIEFVKAEALEMVEIHDSEKIDTQLVDELRCQLAMLQVSGLFSLHVCDLTSHFPPSLLPVNV